MTVRTDLPQFTQLLVAREEQSPFRVDLGYDWRAQPPAMLEIGPVLSLDAAKIADLRNTMLRWADELTDHADG